jgi:metallo-beta-lactamase class B
MKIPFAIVLLFAAFLGCNTQTSVPLPPAAELRQADAEAEDDYMHSWRGPGTVTVARGVHVLGRLFPSAAFAIETTQGVILIDCGVSEDVALLRESLWEVGLKATDVRYLLLTHAHYDHVFGANKLRSLSGATVCAGQPDCEVLREPDIDALFSVFPRVDYSGAPITVDRELSDGDIIELGETRIEVLSTPGHTPGSICFLIERDGQTILFSGDVIASLNFGPATYPVRLSPRYRGDAEAYLQTIERLLEMGAPDLLLTGHPRQQRQFYSIRFDEKRWRELLEPAKQELEQVLHRREQDGADFLDETAKQLEPDLWYLGQREGVAVYFFQHRGRSYLVNAPGGAGFKTFLADRLGNLGLGDRTPDEVLLTLAEENAWSGLPSLPSNPQVVAHPELLEVLRSRGIENLSTPGELAAREGLEMEPLELNGSLAFAFTLGGKRILASPNVPRNLTLVWKNRLTGMTSKGALQPQTDELRDSLAADPALAAGYRDDLKKLGGIEPDLWLPAIPMSGQNANVYDDRWKVILEENARQIP